MDETRRYDEREIAEILELATAEPGRPAAPQGESGLSLAELQAIGGEVGIPPTRIASAARTVESGGLARVAREQRGLTRSVTRTVRIERAPTNDEWERLVAELRRTFDAQGSIEQHGEMRSWTNSNLQVHVEPDSDGYAVRMTTRKGNAVQFTLLGSGFVGVGVIIAMQALAGSPDDTFTKAAALAAMGLGMVMWIRTTLPGWARTRAEQMDRLAARIPELMDDGT